MPDQVYEKGDWTLEITYRQKGTMSEGSHGVLKLKGEEVEPESVGQVLDTTLGKIKYYQHPEDAGWTFTVTGWHFARRSRIKQSWDE
jgi:hypothetical protein